LSGAFAEFDFSKIAFQSYWHFGSKATMKTIPLLIIGLALWLSVSVDRVDAQEDLTPPALLDVRIEPDKIDTSKAPATITVTVHVTDDLSGVEWIVLGFRKPGTTQQIGIDIVPGTTWGVLVEGDALNGKYQNTVTLPQYSAFGIWEMYYLALVDNVGNRIDAWRPDNEKGFDESAGWPLLYNSFTFAVGQTETPKVPERRSFIPFIERQ
jgi:hypothetical protein